MNTEDHSFALCLTHDVDRPYKTTFHALYYALRERDPGHLRDLIDRSNPYWQFEEIQALEGDLGVQSAFYFLIERGFRERPIASLREAETWVQLLTRYEIDWPELTTVVRELDEAGWEVGLHGSIGTATDRERLRHEKERIESIVGHPLKGGRQHYLDMERPTTWEHYAATGLDYDTSLGSSTEYGFEHGYDVHRPFDDEFVVFPLTLMDSALPDPGERFEEAWMACESLLAEAEQNDAVMTVLWHPRLFCEAEFPGYRRIYRRMIEEALARDAWVGSPGQYYDQFLDVTPGSIPSPQPIDAGNERV